MATNRYRPVLGDDLVAALAGPSSETRRRAFGAAAWRRRSRSGRRASFEPTRGNPARQRGARIGVEGTSIWVRVQAVGDGWKWLGYRSLYPARGRAKRRGNPTGSSCTTNSRVCACDTGRGEQGGLSPARVCRAEAAIFAIHQNGEISG
jgi:hypothetical protein